MLLRRLPLLWILIATNALVAYATWGYYALTQASTYYDESSFPTFGHDSAKLPVAGDKENCTAGTSSPFASFAGFLAAGFFAAIETS